MPEYTKQRYVTSVMIYLPTAVLPKKYTLKHTVTVYGITPLRHNVQFYGRHGRCTDSVCWRHTDYNIPNYDATGRVPRRVRNTTPCDRKHAAYVKQNMLSRSVVFAVAVAAANTLYCPMNGHTCCIRAQCTSRLTAPSSYETRHCYRCCRHRSGCCSKTLHALLNSQPNPTTKRRC
jgi:hypothetical protein